MEARIGETFRKRLIVFYIPLFLFLVALLFPFYWMLITSLKPDFELYNARNAPFFVWHPTLCALVAALSKHPLYALGLEHVVHRHGLDDAIHCLPVCSPDMRCPV